MPRRASILASILSRYADDGCCYVRNTRTGTEGTREPVLSRALSTEERQTQEQLEEFLDRASEDALIAEVLLPLFQTLGFQRVSSAGHEDKALEYGRMSG